MKIDQEISDGGYNILPLDPASANQAIMKYPEIQAAVVALRDTRGLPWPEYHKKKLDGDLLDWLQAMFGFQKDNVANQREHLILLLANVHNRKFPIPNLLIQLDDRALTEAWEKLFMNYNEWCKFLNRKSSLWLPNTQQDVRKCKLLYMGLYLLIWGEAANLRFMPECLCYIFHHMAIELFGSLNGYVNPMTGESVKLAYGGEEEAFLREVVTPIYEVIAKEAERSKRGRLAHSQWRNYDDLNEYFWSDECFRRLGWPMCADADFFHLPAGWLQCGNTEYSKPAYRDRWVGKVNFVEIRSFWHIFRSYDRMWSFFILCLQAMIIVAWNGSGDPAALFTPDVSKKVLSIFITAAILKLGQAVLDVIFTWKARRSMSDDLKLRYNLKVVSAAAWVIILTVTYAHPWENRTIKSWFGNDSNSPSLFILAVVIYLFPNALLFLFPSIRRFLGRSPDKIWKQMIWWSQELRPPLYVGRGMHESAFSLFKYTLFWVFLIITKLAFSYYIEIKPLVGPTKAIMSVQVTKFQSREFFERAKDNIGVVIALWAPIILVYFMDTQIWYALFSTFFGGMYGVVRRIGEIQTLRMVRCRFKSLPGVFNARLIGKEKAEPKKDGSEATSSQSNARVLSKKEKARFAQLWNTIITGFREEDLISNREMDLLLVPYWADRELEDIIQWPPFLLANSIRMALYLAKDSNCNDWELRKIIETDRYMSCAIRECYAQFRNIIMLLVQGELEKKIIESVFSRVDKSLEDGNLLSKFKMSALPRLHDCFVKLIKYLLDNKQEDWLEVAILFLDMLEVFTREMMVEAHTSSLIDLIHGGPGPEGITPPLEEKLFTSAGAIRFPIHPAKEAWKEKIKRLYLLLTTEESDRDVPSNFAARRRISFFSNSLFMEMPAAPKVRNMLSFSVLTPYCEEEVLFSVPDLRTENEDGVSILFYLQKIFPDEWTNFLERVKCESEEELRASNKLEEQLRLWASYRGQTLTRTVRGMMYYRKALELQAFLDMTTNEELMEGYNAVELNTEEHPRGDQSLLAQCQAEADMKFTYVVSCQQYGIDKISALQRAKDILRLMTAYPSVRVAYIDEVEEPSLDGTNSNIQKAYYSTLVKAALPKSSSSSEPVPNLDQVIYRIKLPGPAILGEGKSENQNHAIIFTRGEGLQTIDMNQDNYMEEALKMRNLLQEFLKKHDGVRHPTILGLREHIFTGSVSSLARFMSIQETSFVTIGQRLLANPLKVRFHYGHSDVFDRLFHLTRGGVSKASKVINLSEDVFAGFSSTLREGNVTHHEYIQVGKGRDASLNQISMFEAKLATGYGEQTLSRDVYRLGGRFDFFRMLSCYYTTIGLYISALITVFTVYVFLYGRLYLVLSGLEKELSTQPGIKDNKPFQVDFASQSFVQMGFSLVLPTLMEIWVERGVLTVLSDFLLMQLQLAPVFFTFSLGTKTHYYGRTLIHGGAKYKATGRGLVVFHAKFADNYRMYSRSHFVKGFELMILLLVYQIFGQSYRGSVVNTASTIYIWFMVGSWLFAPFLFNPSGFEWHKIVDDWTDWNNWLCNDSDEHSERSWEAWWEEEQEHLRHSGKCGIIAEIILALRFFIYYHGLVYYLNITKHTNIVQVYGISGLVFFFILFGMKIISYEQRKVGADIVIHLIKGFMFLTFVAILVTLIAPTYVTLQYVMACVLASMLMGWGMLLIARACRPLVAELGIWGTFKTLAHGYEIVMGFFLFTPVAFLAWFPYFSEFQSRMLFTQAFGRGLQFSRILGGQRKDEEQSSNMKVTKEKHTMAKQKF